MKGITAVIVIILLMLLVVVTSGMFYYWSGRLQSDASNKGMEEMEHYATETGRRLNIESVSDCKVYVRNVGTEIIPANTINLLVDSRSVTFSSNVERIGLGDSATLTITQSFSCEKEECYVKTVSATEQLIKVDASQLQCP